MVMVNGHFDGRVIVPDEPVNLRRGQRVTVHIEEGLESDALPPAAPGAVFGEFEGMISKEDLSLMARALDDCSRVDIDGW